MKAVIAGAVITLFGFLFLGTFVSKAEFNETKVNTAIIKTDIKHIKEALCRIEDKLH